jgi:hypothetical protein
VKANWRFGGTSLPSLGLNSKSMKKSTWIRQQAVRGLLVNREEGGDIRSQSRLTFTGLHCDASHKIENFLTTTVGTLYHTCCNVSYGCEYIVTCLVTEDGVWIRNWIYWALTNRNYKQLYPFHCFLHVTVHYSTYYVLSICCIDRLLPGNGSELCRFLGFRVPLLPFSLAARLTLTLHGRNPWSFFCLLAASVHHWLVLTACRLTVSSVTTHCS